ncbi:MAG TPA: glycoside hydrolase family 2 TIM barrel-domain containing protein [Candidatus Acidoferrum sp.]|nr:glycoside hydrolase family 2 TIM barrel-domain containing protein [Candidatus Acidoferrum sp.]
MTSRRKFLISTATFAAGVAGASAEALAAQRLVASRPTESSSLDGEWLFRTDPEDAGLNNNWFAAHSATNDWTTITVPHTWQVHSPFAEYRGVAWYQRNFDSPERWMGSAIRIEFAAVFHTATVWVNGRLAGEHARKGYTTFAFDISHLVRAGAPNSLVVRVDNSFNLHMLPRGRSSDFPHDGGIFRPVQLLITAEVFVEQLDVDAVPNARNAEAQLAIAAHCRNISSKTWRGRASFRVIEDDTGLEVLANPNAGVFSMAPRSTHSLIVSATLANPKLWHFDHPHLYRLEFVLSDAREAYLFSTTFGVRLFEVKDGALYLNGERVRLMGVERMGGSNPEFGMAEPKSWIAHDHNDLKHLNCVFTRVHWPQDSRVLDYCDRHGILIQSEIPAWGWETFKGMATEPDADILENGIEQLREMIARDRNHPSLVIWGLCNEVGGQLPAAYQFAKRMLAEAKKLDPHRLCSYASNSLEKAPERDVAGLMDLIEMNEYVGTWSPGNLETIGKYLDAVHAAFPGKPVIISEYGYCACVPERPEDDTRRIEILRSHDAVFRSKDYVAGAIFFCYNDYRSQVGFSGVGALQQNIHGVVDVFGAKKPSFDALREESSPIVSLSVENHSNTFRILLKTRNDLPAYTLRGYHLRAVTYDQAGIPLEQQEIALPDLPPGNEGHVELAFRQPNTPLRVQFDVIRPTRFSAFSFVWKL